MTREVISPAELNRVRFRLGGLTQDQAAAICGTDRKTFNHWERGRRRIPIAAYRLLYLHVCGFPIATCSGARDQWEGWRFCKGELYSPENVGFSAGEIQHVRVSVCERDQHQADGEKDPAHPSGLAKTQ